ncbi:MAG: cobalt-precorrin-6A reductase [Chloroflexi bacterium]|nr:cobalt-precorrin-6A reductase [Chloroflexota bacterium]
MSAGRSSGSVLVLGGTSEARRLAGLLTEANLPVISSLAGRLTEPRLPAGEVRIGGFGGAGALAAWLAEHRIVAVVDATHPFAAGIGVAAADACEQVGLPLLRLERPGWREQPGDRWHWADDIADAARRVPALGRRVLLTIGRQGINAFADLTGCWFLVRCIERPTGRLPTDSDLLLDRGPYTVDGERDLIDRYRIDLIVTKNSGGSATDAKLVAARTRGLPVIIVRRPARPRSQTVTDAESALAWVQALA